MDDPVPQQFEYDPIDPILTIGVTAKKIGVAPETLRLYEREGLVIPHRTKTGRRLYSQKDLVWIACIRRQINVNKLNIAGIKRLLALIPCWDLKPCPMSDRRNCPAYLANDKVCWELQDLPAICSVEKCRLCHVYQEADNVGHLKETYRVTVRK
jgi:MerR family transcriptional regulator/heat shock protein HspR